MDASSTTDQRLDRLTMIVDSLAASVVAHDNQIEALIRAAESHQEEMDKLRKEWQAYLNTIHPRH